MATRSGIRLTGLRPSAAGVGDEVADGEKRRLRVGSVADNEDLQSRGTRGSRERPNEAHAWKGRPGGQLRHSALSTQANAMVNNTMRSLAVDPFMPLRLP